MTTQRASINRRVFLKQAAAAAGISIAAQARFAGAASPAPARIHQVFPDLNNIHKWDTSNGDTWDPFWASDDNLYAFNCDGRGFGPKRMNLAFNKLVGESPMSVAGAQINSMDAYGLSGEKKPDGATWKACGQECIDGVFYAFVSRNTYGKDSGDPLLRQTAANCSLIKSTDRGITWTRSADENLSQPMWPGPGFGAPFFIHYGRNGGSLTRDGADRYVYASSTNGFWNDGDCYILGRIERSKLPALQSEDWSYYAGGDGSRDRNWPKRIAGASPILSSPAHCGQGPICYIPALDLYLMVSWYNTEKMTKWFAPNRMRYDFYQAAHPWGPWEQVDSFDDSFISSGHMYGPSLCAKFQQSTGSEVKISLFTSGCPFGDVPAGLYKMWEIPLILRTRPAPSSFDIPGGDPRVVYGGAWHGGDGKLASLHPQTCYTNTAGSSAELKFEGTGVALITEKGPEFGTMEVFVDGRRNAQLDLRTPTFPRISSVQCFSATGLARGTHNLRIVNNGEGFAAIELLRVMD